MTSIVQYAPRFSVAAAAQAARDLFGVQGRLSPLPSERDQNFKISVPDGDGWVLKIANAGESRESLDFQNQVMRYLERHRKYFQKNGPPSPQIVSSREGDDIATLKDAQGKPYFIRLLRYVPGKPLARVRPHDEGLMRSLGDFFGRVDAVLGDFDHRAAHRKFHWDLKQAAAVVTERIHFIHAPARRGLVARFLERFCAKTQPRTGDLPQSVIHNDANDYNVLVTCDDAWRHRVAGVIDFGDMVYTHTVSEAAIACAYAMLDKKDPLTTAGRVVAGYHAARALSAAEVSVLFDLICMRLCMSVCHSAHQGHAEPDNAYLRISEEPVWRLLRQLEPIHSRLAEYLFRDACGMQPVPRSEAVVGWLEAGKQLAAPVLDADFQDPPPVVLDLSVESPLAGPGADAAEAHRLNREIFDALHHSGRAAVGIGRYAEPRIIYTTDAFQSQSDEMPERRTLHLGVDLFAAPGTTVRAFREGVVHSCADNARPRDYGPTIILEHTIDAAHRCYSLYGHLSRESLHEMPVGRRISKGEAIGTIGASAVNGGWPPHLHFQIITDILGRKGDFPGAARPDRRRVWLRLCPDPGPVLGLPQTVMPSPAGDAGQLLNVRRRYLGKNLSLAYRRPIHVVRGRGQYLYDREGRAYLDGVNNVCHVGHCHPTVVGAGQRQLALLNTNTRYLYDALFGYTQTLLTYFPDPLKVCFLTCTGSEANELALRLAGAFTGRKDVITLESAYHGNTQTLIDISPYKHDGPGGSGAPPWVHKVPIPDRYRGLYRGDAVDTGERYARHVQQALDRIDAAGGGVRAFICESMPGCAGQIVLPAGYMQAAFQHVRRAGGLCIADEVQVGFGRAGTHFWSFETQGVVPDIVTLGKPIGNGHPLAAVITTREIADRFANGMEYFNTFGGNPVSCAIGMAVLKVIETESLQAHAAVVGGRLLQGFNDLKNRFALIGDVRGRGLFIGVELVKDRETRTPAARHAAYIINRLRDHGILLSTDGPFHNVLKLKPPMVFSATDADRLIHVLEKILQEDCLQV